MSTQYLLILFTVVIEWEVQSYSHSYSWAMIKMTTCNKVNLLFRWLKYDAQVKAQEDFLKQLADGR